MIPRILLISSQLVMSDTYLPVSACQSSVFKPALMCTGSCRISKITSRLGYHEEISMSNRPRKVTTEYGHGTPSKINVIVL